MAGIDNIKGKGFDKNPQNINTKGQPKKVSIRNELSNLLQKDGILTMTGNDIVEIGTNDDNEQFVKVKIPTQQALALKMLSIARGKATSVNTLRAIIHINEQFDGKSPQTIEISKEQTDYDFSKLTDREFKTFAKLEAKCRISN